MEKLVVFKEERINEIISKVKEFMEENDMKGNFTYTISSKPNKITGMYEGLDVVYRQNHEDYDCGLIRYERQDIFQKRMEDMYGVWVNFECRLFNHSNIEDFVEVVYRDEMKIKE